MKQLTFLLFGLLFHSCYSTHSVVKGPRKLDYSRGSDVPIPHITNILYKVTYDSLDHRIFYGMENDPSLLRRGRLFDTMRIEIQESLKNLLSGNGVNENALEELNIPFFDYFTIYGKEARIPRGSHEFHRSPWFDYHQPIDSVVLNPSYNHLTNTLIAEFKLLKMYRDGRGGVPGFSANIQLRFGYIGHSEVNVYRNFLIITTISIDGGVFWRLGNENIDWWRPRHIKELVKRMQYELGLTDKKGRPISNK